MANQPCRAYSTVVAAGKYPVNILAVPDMAFRAEDSMMRKRASSAAAVVLTANATDQNLGNQYPTVEIEPAILESLGTLAHVRNKSITTIINSALKEWMETTGDLLLDFYYNKKEKERERDSASGKTLRPDNLLEFPVMTEAERAKRIRSTFMHQVH